MPNRLYINPAKNGAYAALAADHEEILSEIVVTARSRVAVSAFYVNAKENFDTIKITKLRFHATRGWLEDSAIKVNNFGLEQIHAFLNVIVGLDLADASKSRLDLSQVANIDFDTLLKGNSADQIVKELSESPELVTDIFALVSKRSALEKFKGMMAEETTEPEWQKFFEENDWIFGLGLNFVPLEKIYDKFESTTTGSSVDGPGKRVDALMKTKAEVSQSVLAEIKRSDTPILSKDEYRRGC